MKAGTFRVLTATLLAALCAGLAFFGVFGRLDTILGDALYQKTGIPSADIAVIGIDEATLRAYGPFAAWSREKTAALIRVLNLDPANRPAVIAIDIIFESEGDPAIDAALVAACIEGGNVVLATQSVFEMEAVEKNGVFSLGLNETAVMEPFPALQTAAVRLGHVNTALSDDGAVRTALYSLTQNGRPTLGLSSAAVELYHETTGKPICRPPLNESGGFPIRFTAKPEAYYGGNSFFKVLSGEIPAARFKDSLVFIGAYAPGMMDAYRTPIDPTQLMNGVEIHANIANAALSNRYFQDVPLWAQALYTFIIVFFAALVFLCFPVGRAAAAFFCTMGLYLLAAFALARYGVRINLVYLPAGLILGYAGALVMGYCKERRRRSEITGVFKQYVSPEVVDDLISRENAAAIVNRRRDITVMFLDIRSFTSLSERMEPEALVELLSEYLSLITRISFQYGGMVDKFLGDGAMVLFNTPLDKPDHELAALRAARDIVRGAAVLSEKYKGIYGRDVMLGIGVHCGPAIVGSIGTQYRMEYTAIGDTVNTASRLQGQAAAGDVVMSDTLYERVKNRVTAKSIGAFSLKGKALPMQCYCLLDIDGN